VGAVPEQGKGRGRVRRRVVAAPTTIESAVQLTMALPAPAEAAAPTAPAAPTEPAAPREPARRPLRQRSAVLPAVPESESAAAWGDGSDSNDARLVRDVPPHW
jgi:hypothetical protein